MPEQPLVTTPRAIGIDVGGTGIKAGLVDLDSGLVIGHRLREATPSPATPGATIDPICKLVEALDPSGLLPVGIGFPGPLSGGIIVAAPNLVAEWAGWNLKEVLEERFPLRSVAVINDCDAVAHAELTYAEPEPRRRLIITFGTGIGTSLIEAGRVIEGLELGHIEIDGADAECYCAGKVRVRMDMTLGEFAPRMARYIETVSRLTSASVVRFGGGISNSFEDFPHPFELPGIEVGPVRLRNGAGMVGSALVAGVRARGARP